MSEKVIGYIFLGLGVMMIIFSGFSVYGVFTRSVKPVELFNFPGISFDFGQSVAGNLPVKTKPTEIISAEVLNYTSNLFAHLMLMGFIANIGFKLAQVGTYLIRPIVVKLKEKEVVSKSIS